MKDVYTENHKALLKDIEEDINRKVVLHNWHVRQVDVGARERQNWEVGDAGMNYGGQRQPGWKKCDSKQGLERI